MAAVLSNGSRGSNGLRLSFCLAVAFLPIGAGLMFGCGGDDAEVAPPPKQGPADATVPLVMVVTGGGGAPTSSSSSGGVKNPFGDLPDAGSSSGMGLDSGSSSGGPGDGSISDDASDGGADALPPSNCPTTPIPCGANPGDTCDLRTKTCCVTLDLQESCLTSCDPMRQAAVHCTNTCDCSGGQVCCGVINQIVGVVQSVCQTVADGGFCNPNPPTNTQASAQLCTVDSECKNGEQCIFQTCEFGAMFHLCGLQSQDPFDCTAN